MSQAPTEPRPGDTVGPYRIAEAIGRGRMGVVFKATTGDGDPVAIKMITSELSQDDVFLRRFEREARSAERIEHPNVVPVLARGTHEGLPYLVQRLIGGGSLADRIERTGPLGLAETLRLATGTAAGVDALHAAGVVHRDLKPANVLLDAGGTPHITDFGLAKDGQDSDLTRPGQALGSLDYMSPEQIRGEQVSPASDVYSFGCVLWECLTGRPPFGGRPSMRVLFAHLQEEPPDLAAQAPGVSSAAARAIARALEKEPEQRPGSASGYVHAVTLAAGAALA